jgi:hypothetical protein
MKQEQMPNSIPSAETEAGIGTNDGLTSVRPPCIKPNVGSSLSPTTKDWTGNKKSVFTTLGASSHSTTERQKHDYYATDPKAIEHLLKLENFVNVWECACGEGHLSKVLLSKNIHGKSSDLIDRGFGEKGIDFLGIDIQEWNGDIITNPPFKYAKEFVLKALQIIPTGNKVAMFLRMQFLESKDRKHLFVDFPPKHLFVTSSRISCAMNGDFDNNTGGAMAYCWFVWQKGFKGQTTIKWFN